MSPNVDNFFIFELRLRIITFFLNVVLIMAPNVNNFFLFELPIITFFFECSLDKVSKCE